MDLASMDADAVFKLFDVDSSGTLDETELFAALSDFGLLGEVGLWCGGEGGRGEREGEGNAHPSHMLVAGY